MIPLTGLLALAPAPACAAAFDGRTLAWPWAVPFIGLLLSIAIGPLAAGKFWHRHYGKVAVAWSLLTLASIAAVFGASAAVEALVHALLGEYLSFIVLLFALYVVAGGVLVTGALRGTPATNTAILGIGALMASFVGTTGASMILIRPLLRANAGRRYSAHVVVFFIFLVGNIGGALSPLGDPPLFVGFLRGVDFFWTTTELLAETALMSGIVLAAFLLIDAWHFRKDRGGADLGEAQPFAPLRVSGAVNFVLIGAIVGVILISGVWRSDITFEISGTSVPLQYAVRDGALLVIALVSLALTPEEHRAANGFTWEPIREVAILFAGIFVCIIPVLAMLRAGPNGAFAWLLEAASTNSGQPNDLAYFWLTGVLSAFLDNAPTYLVFFELAGGDAQRLMTELGSTLAAISMGAVYMGAMTYVGNAPNFMVYAIVTQRGVPMPSFFGYMLWSCGFLLLPLILLSFVAVAPR